MSTKVAGRGSRGTVTAMVLLLISGACSKSGAPPPSHPEPNDRNASASEEIAHSTPTRASGALEPEQIAQGGPEQASSSPSPLEPEAHPPDPEAAPPAASAEAPPPKELSEEQKKVLKKASLVYERVQLRLEKKDTDFESWPAEELEAYRFIDAVVNAPDERHLLVVNATKVRTRNRPGIEGTRVIGKLGFNETVILCGQEWVNGVLWYSVTRNKWGCGFGPIVWVASEETAIKGGVRVRRELVRWSKQSVGNLRKQSKDMASVAPKDSRLLNGRVREANTSDIATVKPVDPLLAAAINCSASWAVGAVTGGLVDEAFKGKGPKDMVEMAKFFSSSLAGTAATSEFKGSDVLKGLVASAAGVALGPLGEIGTCIMIA